MAKRYIVQITGGTSSGPYNVYYNVVNPNNFAIDVNTNLPATGLSYSYLSLGIQVEVPDNASNIIVYNVSCGISGGTSTLSQIVNLTVRYEACNDGKIVSGRFIFYLDKTLGDNLFIEESTLIDNYHVPLLVKENNSQNTAKPLLPLTIPSGSLTGITIAVPVNDLPYYTSSFYGNDIVYNGLIYSGDTQWTMPNGQTVIWFTQNNPQVKIDFQPDLGNTFCIVPLPTETPAPTPNCKCFGIVVLNMISSGTVTYDNCYGGTFTFNVNAALNPTYTIYEGDYVNIASLRGTASWTIASLDDCGQVPIITPGPTNTPGVTATPTPTPSPTIAPPCFGYLYNWYALTGTAGNSITSSDSWSVPTNTEIQSLFNTANNSNNLKLIDTTTYWNSTNINATNLYGFNGKGSGRRNGLNGTFDSLKDVLELWTKSISPINSSLGYSVSIDSSDPNLDYISYNSKRSGASVRLVKNTTLLTQGQTGTYTGNDGRVYNTICIGTKEWLSEDLTETLYRNGTHILNITNNSLWTGTTSGAYSIYNNNMYYVSGCQQLITPTPTPSPTPTPTHTPTPSPTIDLGTPTVTRAPRPGITINNYSGGRIDGISPAFFIISVNDFPLLSNQVSYGSIISPCNTTIAVSLIGPNVGGCLTLTKNGVDLSSKNVAASISQAISFTVAEHGGILTTDKIIFTLENYVCY